MSKYQNNNKVAFFVIFLFQTIQLLGQPTISSNSNSDSVKFITYRTFFETLEKRDSVRIFYKQEWFKEKKINSSFTSFQIDDVLDRVKRLTGLSYVKIAPNSIVFLPFHSGFTSSSGINHTDYIVVGNPDEYGKYSKAVVRGKILDGKTGEPLSGAMLSIEKLKLTKPTDANGNFSVTVPVGEYNVILRYIGYENLTRKIRVTGSGRVNFELFEKSTRIKEVEVSAQMEEFNVSSTQMGVERLSAKDIKELPSSLGEKDIIKSMALLPGVQTTGEFGAGFNVRGGSADQNLILVEGVPFFNSSHVFGLTSTLNADDVENVTLLKAGIPARYGERASSVMDIRLGGPKAKKFFAKGGIGLLNSRLSVQFPMIHDKATLLMGGRSSYSDWLLHKLPDYDLQNSSASFYDLDALYTYQLNAHNKLILFGYYSQDKFSFDKNTHYNYSSILGSCRWIHLFSRRLSSSVLTGVSQYKYGVNELDSLHRSEGYQVTMNAKYNNLRWNFTWLPNDNHSVDFGLNGILYGMMPGKKIPYGNESIIKPLRVQSEKGLEMAVYLSDNFTVLPKLNAEIGLRYVNFLSLGPSTVLTYTSGLPLSTETISDTLHYRNNQVVHQYAGVEPRIAFRYSLNDESSVKWSYNHLDQFIHLISNNVIMSPTDTWMLSGTYIKPLISDQYSIGYFRNFKNNTYECSIEGYYKTNKNDIDYKNGAQVLLNDHIETDLLNAFGYDYGIELYVKKSSGSLTGWVSYTYSRSMIKTTGTNASEQINNNQYYPSDFDKPNNLVINVNYHISRRWRLSGTFIYNSGRPVTLPERKYKFQGNQYVYYSARNKYRLPDYNRLDLAITFGENLRARRMWKGSWTLSVLNVYGRKNVYSVYYAKEDPRTYQSTGGTSLYDIYIIGIPLPTLTYNFTF